MLLRWAGILVGEISDPFEHQGTWFGIFRADGQIDAHPEVSSFLLFCQDWLKRCRSNQADAEEFQRYPAFLAPGTWSLEDNTGRVIQIETPMFAAGLSGEISWKSE